jgi:hypothetical protein
MSSDRRHPDLAGVEPPDEAAVDEQVRLRRLKRRLKAGASLLLAAAAGTFLACVKRGDDRPAQAPNPTTPEVPNRPAPRDAGADAAGIDAGQALQRQAPAKHHPKVDRTEHRKGMPVPDNLLE